MNRKSMGIASLVLVIAMIGIAVWVAGLVPNGASLPIHWDANGNPNGFAGKWTALLMPAGITTAVSLLFYFLPAIEPRGEHLERSRGLVIAAWAGILLVMIIVELMAVAGALRWALPVQGLMLAGGGVGGGASCSQSITTTFGRGPCDMRTRSSYGIQRVMRFK